MPSYKTKQKQQTDTKQEYIETEAQEVKDQQELTDDVDDVLADIDEALGADMTEEEMQTQIDQFVQAGGQ